MKEHMNKRAKNIGFLSRIHFVCGVVFMLLTVSGGSVNAQANSVQANASLDQLFTIRDVKVDESDRSASRARQAALLKAEADAYQKLLTKLTQAEDRVRLPELTVAERQALISGIELVDEQTSSRRYVATLNVRFEPSSVSSFLAEHNVPHVLGTGSDILVLHSHQRGLINILWEPDESLSAARDSVDWVNRIRGYKFPRGELRERMAASAAEVAGLDEQAALAVGGVSGLDSVLLMSSKMMKKNDGSSILMYQFLASDSGVVGEGAIPVEEGTPNLDEAAAIVVMYEQVLENVDSSWRQRLLVDTGTQGTLEVLVPSLSLEDLAHVERSLAEISLVQSYQISAIGLPLSQFLINYTGRLDQLALALKFAGLELKPYGTQMIIERRDGLSAPQ